MIKEINRKCASGYLALVIIPVLTVFDAWLFYEAVEAQTVAGIIASVLAFIAILICYKGFFMVNPNEAKVLQLFGAYVGSARDPGLRWANPFYSKEAVSLRVRNFESEVLKVNDNSGNPVKIAAVVVWKVVDSAEAIFEVDDYESFVHIQSEAALRNLTTSYPYEIHDDDDHDERIALRSHPQEIAGKLQTEVQDRLDKAGVSVIEARISHLAYAEEIASAMLKRQQAQAIVAARRQIVDGAVGMVKMALDELRQQGVIDLDEERRAAMVSNLLVVLCGEENVRPVVNTGSLYS